MEFIKKNKKVVRRGSIGLGSLFCILLIAYASMSFIKKDIILRAPSIVSKKEAYVTFVKGDAYYRSSLNTFSAWKQLIVGDRLESAFMLRTRDDAEVHLNFSGKSLIGMRKKSFLIVKEFTAQSLRLELKRGKMFGKFSKLYEGQPIHIKTPTSYTSVVKNSSMEIRLPKIKKKHKKKRPKKTTISVLSGVVTVSGMSPKFIKQVYVSSKQKYALDKKKASKVTTLSKKQKLKLTHLIDGLHETEEYFVTTSIQFEPDSYEIDIDSFFELDKVLRIFQRKEDLNIKIKGHADSQGQDFYNDSLSLKRAQAIREYFVESGVDRDRFRIQGYGENEPVATNTTKKGRSLNRRVEFDIRLE